MLLILLFSYLLRFIADLHQLLLNQSQWTELGIIFHSTSVNMSSSNIFKIKFVEIIEIQVCIS
jgi:hypothetical protein